MKENKVYYGTEKHPKKRGYAIGKLQKFLKLSNLTEKFKNNCTKKGHKNIESAFYWGDSKEGHRFWTQVHEDFGHYCNGKKVFTVYGD